MKKNIKKILNQKECMNRANIQKIPNKKGNLKKVNVRILLNQKDNIKIKKHDDTPEPKREYEKKQT